MADTWWVVIPQSDQGKPAKQLEYVDFRVQYPAGSAGDKAMRARRPYNDPTFQTVVYWKGPFATEAEAKKAQNPQQYSPNPLKDPGQSGSSPFGGLAAIGDFFARLGQPNTWIRAGEVVLGLILIAVGLARITKAVPVATKIAKTVGAVAV